MNTDSLKIFSSNNFNWTGYHGYANASDMPPDMGLTDPFVVRSERTGKIRLFEFVDAGTDPDGKIVGWVFDSVEAGEDFISITVWNDYAALAVNGLDSYL